MFVWNDDYSRMESFDDHACSLAELITQLQFSVGEEFKDLARIICRRSRDIEFAVPRENIFGTVRLMPVIEKLSAAIALFKKWNEAAHDADVASYATHIESRVDFLKSRASHRVLASA